MTFSDWVNKWINQMAHLGWGAFLVLALARHTHLWIALLAVVVFAAFKEGVFDPLTETKTLQGSGWVDFAFWCAGVGLGWLAWL